METDVKYLELVDLKDSQPEKGSGTVVFVPGMGFTQAIWYGKNICKSTITNHSVEATHYLRPINLKLTQVKVVPEPKKKLTAATLKMMADDHIIDASETTNSMEGVFMSGDYVGEKISWIAKRGSGNADWAIYVGWTHRTVEWIMMYGQKVKDPANIRKLVPCDDEALALYRF